MTMKHSFSMRVQDIAYYCLYPVTVEASISSGVRFVMRYFEIQSSRLTILMSA